MNESEIFIYLYDDYNNISWKLRFVEFEGEYSVLRERVVHIGIC